jgi:DNA-binding response OmpR family regulator
MRQQFDLVVLCHAANRLWFDKSLIEMQPGLGRFVVHNMDWQNQLVIPDDGETDPLETFTDDKELRPDVLARSSLLLRRYDAVLMPVSVGTLGWTRQCLASLPRGATIPVIGVMQDLRSGALLDLLELGLTDFLRTPVCPHETRARLIATVSRAPKQTYLREQGNGTSWCAEPPDFFVRTKPKRSRVSASDNLASWLASMEKGDFGVQKKQVVQIFEQQYLRRAMDRAGGRITLAARHSNKNRRAFWELLRKHDLLKEWPSQRQ